jgi:hypothetical protein
MPGDRVLGVMPLGAAYPTIASVLPLTREHVLLLVQDEDTVFYSEERIRYAVVRCDVAQSRCEVAWRSDKFRRHGTVSIVAPE